MAALREGRVSRKTGETDIQTTLILGAPGRFEGATGIGFFDHMLSAMARHGGMHIALACQGDLHVDGHHTVEDIGLCLGEALDTALGQRRGIARFGEAVVPMDEALARVTLDVSGRPFLAFSCDALPPMIGDFDAQLVVEFLRAFSQRAKLTLHAEARGDNGHHIVEALFKALGRALKLATVIEDDSPTAQVPSTKETL